MKLVIIALVAIHAVQVFADGSTLADKATALRNRMLTIVSKLNKMKSNVDQTVPKISSSDFGLKQNPKIAALQNAINSGKSSCQSDLNNMVDSLTGQLRNSAKITLPKVSHAIDERITRLNKIANIGLQGSGLEKAMKACNDPSQHWCAITGIYVNSADKGDDMIKKSYSDYTSPQLLEKFAEQSNISTQLENINNVVRRCLGS